MVRDVSISLIERGIRIRDVNQDQVAALAASISVVGLLNPITVRSFPVIRNGSTVDGFILVGGLHRLEAMIRLGAQEIAAQIVDLDGPAAVIAECDENLCGTNLTPAERALFTKRRKEAYEALHPETKHGATGGTNAGKSRSEVAKFATSVDRFTSDTALKTGKSERAIQLDASRGERIPDNVLSQVAGTDLDKGVVLDRLAKAPSPEAALAAIKKERELAEAHKRNRETDRAIALTDAQQFADWLMARLDLNELPVLISWLEGCKPKDVIAALRREAA